MNRKHCTHAIGQGIQVKWDEKNADPKKVGPKKLKWETFRKTFVYFFRIWIFLYGFKGYARVFLKQNWTPDPQFYADLN
jgi:hypothetical protein